MISLRDPKVLPVAAGGLELAVAGTVMKAG